LRRTRRWSDEFAWGLPDEWFVKELEPGFLGQSIAN